MLTIYFSDDTEQKNNYRKTGLIIGKSHSYHAIIKILIKTPYYLSHLKHLIFLYC